MRHASLDSLPADVRELAPDDGRAIEGGSPFYAIWPLYKVIMYLTGLPLSGNAV
jgi:hypothetical protein